VRAEIKLSRPDLKGEELKNAIFNLSIKRFIEEEIIKHQEDYERVQNIAT